MFTDYWEEKIWAKDDKIEALRKVLRQVQWGPAPNTLASECPWCLNQKIDGHTPDCDVGKLI